MGQVIRREGDNNSKCHYICEINSFCRMFGTFECERDSGIVYGLVDQPQFWNPVKHQVLYSS